MRKLVLSTAHDTLRDFLLILGGLMVVNAIVGEGVSASDLRSTVIILAVGIAVVRAAQLWFRMRRDSRTLPTTQR